MVKKAHAHGSNSPNVNLYIKISATVDWHDLEIARTESGRDLEIAPTERRFFDQLGFVCQTLLS